MYTQIFFLLRFKLVQIRALLTRIFTIGYACHSSSFSWQSGEPHQFLFSKTHVPPGLWRMCTQLQSWYRNEKSLKSMCQNRLVTKMTFSPINLKINYDKCHILHHIWSIVFCHYPAWPPHICTKRFTWRDQK